MTLNCVELDSTNLLNKTPRQILPPMYLFPHLLFWLRKCLDRKITLAGFHDNKICLIFNHRGLEISSNKQVKKGEQEVEENIEILMCLT